jgi:hypothetical protein
LTRRMLKLLMPSWREKDFQNRKKCPDKLYALMLKCWEKEPSQPPSFQEVLNGLLDFSKTIQIKKAAIVRWRIETLFTPLHGVELKKEEKVFGFLLCFREKRPKRSAHRTKRWPSLCLSFSFCWPLLPPHWRHLMLWNTSRAMFEFFDLFLLFSFFFWCVCWLVCRDLCMESNMLGI